MKYKELDCFLKVKDVDTSQRIVTGYFNAFDYIDHDMDVIRKGAFKKSLNERGAKSEGKAKIKHLLFHDFTKIVGVPNVLKEDDLGLYFETKMPNTTDGNDTLIKYLEGIYDNHSIGFSYVQGKINKVERDSEQYEASLATIKNYKEVGDYFYEITEVKLYEGSTVGIGSNELTPFLGVKNHEAKAVKILKASEKLDLLVKHLTNGTTSDMCMIEIEAQVNQIKNFINILATENSDIKTVESSQPVIKEPFDTSYLFI